MSLRFEVKFRTSRSGRHPEFKHSRIHTSLYLPTSLSPQYPFDSYRLTSTGENGKPKQQPVYKGGNPEASGNKWVYSHFQIWGLVKVALHFSGYGTAHRLSRIKLPGPYDAFRSVKMKGAF
jgi:hypothetical protein